MQEIIKIESCKIGLETVNTEQTLSNNFAGEKV